MRITGLATGLDVDQVITDTMRPYRIKIQEQQQNKEILEIKQKLYRDVLKDSREFYNKYFDITKTYSILSSKNWTSTKFESSNDSLVSVTAGSDAKVGNYTVTGVSATAAKSVVTEGIEDGNTIVINGKEFELLGTTGKQRADNLNKDLKNAGINVSVRYSDLAGTDTGNISGFVFESTVLGKDTGFTIGGTLTNVGSGVKGKDPTYAKIDGFNIEGLKKAGKIKIDGKDIDLELKTEDSDDDIINTLNKKISEYEYKASKDENGNITLTSTLAGSKGEDLKLKIDGVNNINFTGGTDGTQSTVSMNIADIKNEKVLVVGNNTINIDFSKVDPGDEEKYLNAVLEKSNIGVTAEVDEFGKVIFSSAQVGEKSEFSIKTTSSDAIVSNPGRDAKVVIKDDKGGTYTHVGNTNSITIDGITFKINGELPKDGIKIIGKSDITQTKDTIVNFVNDYNKLIEKINSLTLEKRNRGYMPLTDEQKKEMSESEIKLWNEKVEQGQLSRDSDLSRIANAMKNAMRSVMGDSNLEKFGIKPVSDYGGTKNGTFTIDEEKLTSALENNIEDVKKLFISQPSDDDSLTPTEKSKQTGIAYKLKEILYEETVTVSSRLIKKAGIEGTTSAITNELTRSMEKYDRKMKDLEVDFSRREQALYTKYATLETMMNKLNSQQSYLMSQLGMA